MGHTYVVIIRVQDIITTRLCELLSHQNNHIIILQYYNIRECEFLADEDRTFPLCRPGALMSRDNIAPPPPPSNTQLTTNMIIVLEKLV